MDYTLLGILLLIVAAIGVGFLIRHIVLRAATPPANTGNPSVRPPRNPDEREL